MNIPRNEADLQSLIVGQVEESISLDYKHGAALARDDKKRDEITKDVSAFANSAGGLIVYGIAEGPTATTKHLPLALAPVDRTQFSKEWLEQVIQRIQPRIEGIEIIPIPLASAPDHVAYAVNIPQSDTAHQAADKRYYKRHNFMAVPMEDYELRDVMNRLTHPIIELEAEIVCEMRSPFSDYAMSFPGQVRAPYPEHLMHIRAFNRGKAIAHHIVCITQVPTELLDRTEENDDGSVSFDNHIAQFTGEVRGGSRRYGNPQWMPILPQLSRKLRSLQLRPDFYRHLADEFAISWVAYCDTSPARSGEFTQANVKRTISEAYRQFVTRP
jgi:hypothetical protein